MSPQPVDIPDAMSSDNCVDISYGVRLECVPQLDHSVSLTLRYGPHAVCTQNFPINPAKPSEGALQCQVDKLIQADLQIAVDYALGQISGTGGYVKTYSPHDGDWCTVIAPAGEVLMRFAPCGGAIGDQAQVNPNDMDFKHRFGDLNLATPNVLRLFVSNDSRAISNIGQMVKRGLFSTPDYHDFVFNTVAYVGKPDAGNVGRYTDPDSPWFNLFVGYYEIDAPVSAGWDRPFGYEQDSAQVRSEDLVRLGKADWNWFSNWNYGTPSVEIEPYDAIDVPGAKVEPKPAVQIGATWWQPVEIGEIEVASTYESDSRDATKLVLNSTYLTPIWRYLFGSPCPRPNHPRSFIPTKLHGSVLMAFQKDGDVYKTRIFGGTIDARDRGDKDGFLATQVTALRNLIATRYGDLGFQDNPDQAMPASPAHSDGDVPAHDVGEVKGPGPIVAPSPEKTKPSEKGDQP